MNTDDPNGDLGKAYFEALKACHNRNIILTGREPQTKCICKADSIRLKRESCAVCIAEKFLQEASRLLLPRQLHDLIGFLTQQNIPALDTADLQSLKNAKMKEFYLAETAASGQDERRLADSSGPEDAELGIILQVQSEDDVIGAFWDTRSATIGLIDEKGVNPELHLGMTGIGGQMILSMSLGTQAALRRNGDGKFALFMTNFRLIFSICYHCLSSSLAPALFEKVSGKYLAQTLSR